MPGIRLYLSFEGRIGRATFWLWYFVPALLLAIAARVVDVQAEFTAATTLLAFLLLWPSLAVQAKRFHDCDMSSWWLLLHVIPGGTAAVLIVNGFFRGTNGANRFGEPPQQSNSTIERDGPQAARLSS